MLRATEIFLQDTVKKQMLITLIVVKPSGANEHEVSDQISQSVAKIKKFSVDCFVNAFIPDVKLGPPTTSSGSQLQANLQLRVLSQLYSQSIELFALLVQTFHQRLLVSQNQTAIINVRKKNAEMRGLRSDEIC